MKVGVYIPAIDSTLSIGRKWLFTSDKAQHRREVRPRGFDDLQYPGIMMLKDALERAGIEVGFCSFATAGDCDVVLLSVTSARDVWRLYRERLTWRRSPRLTIAGGAGLLNVRPILDMADAFVFGRAEEIIAPLVDQGSAFEHESVCWARDFSPEKKYRIAQVDDPCPHPVTLPSGKTWTEKAIGCKQRCLFCAYTWHRKQCGTGQAYSGNASTRCSQTSEFSMMELAATASADWPPNIRMVGLDGMSERLRLSVKKRISRDTLRKVLHGFAQRPDKLPIKVYCVVGFPDEGPSDYDEFLDDFTAVDAELGPASDGFRRSFMVHLSPFVPFPATPCATWATQMVDHPTRLRAHWRRKLGSERFSGKRFRLMNSTHALGLTSHALDVMAFRCTETDAPALRRLCSTPSFWGASGARSGAPLSADKRAARDR